jgi:hypothetical protein
MEINDERKDKSIKFAVVAEDIFLSGWGKCKGGKSLAAWVVDSSLNIDRVFDWVQNRSDMEKVRIVSNIDNYTPADTVVHLSIYEAGDNHPAFK